ncbi:hypothetical protein [Actinoplanes sp. NPDC023714]|uniref:DUF7691 family protein n=1 Tax=Actinoplanes sp. NPDC023714 TaxID=3154322 RepID=UPI0033FEC982
MGYGAQAWAVDLGLLRADIGSGDRELARRSGAAFAERRADMQSSIDEVTGEEGAVTLTDGFSVSDLLFGGSPVPLPPIGDFPGIGYREYGSLEEPAERLSWFDVKGDEAEEFSGPAYDVFQWLSEAHRRKVSVVAFFH